MEFNFVQQMEAACSDHKRRKRAPHNSACVVCRKAHRACDGNRPCGRCVALGYTEDCASPPKKKHKKKRKLITQEEPTQEKTEAILPSQALSLCTENSESSLLAVLVDRVQELSTTTKVMLEKQQILTEQLALLKSQTPTFLAIESTPPLSPASTWADNLLLLDQGETSNQTSALGKEAVALENKMLSVVQEINELAEITHRSLVSISPKIGTLVREEPFEPFVLDDSTKPFFVFQIKVDNWPEFIKLATARTQEYHTTKLATVNMLYPSPSFCSICQYSEEELMGPGMERLLPSVHITRREDRSFAQFMFPQPWGVRVSPVFEGRSYWRTKEGKIMTTRSRGQFFYSEDGTVSFGISCVESYCITGITDKDLFDPKSVQELFASFPPPLSPPLSSTPPSCDEESTPTTKALSITPATTAPPSPSRSLLTLSSSPPSPASSPSSPFITFGAGLSPPLTFSHWS